MEHAQREELVRDLVAGFDTLQVEYQKLFEHQLALEKKLATAREQYNELAKLYGSGDLATPPLSKPPSPRQRNLDGTSVQTVSEILEQRSDATSRDAANAVRSATKAATSLRQVIQRPNDSVTNGVKIWSGPSADRFKASSIMMPSVSESPLEQDFTIEGRPSKLGCPFASMSNKKLSSHAASVLSRYNQDSITGRMSSFIHSSANRVNGRESFARRDNRRESFADPIKAEICGLSDHQQDDHESPFSERAMKEHLTQQESAPDIGVCPIRFLDQHSPEEVATYFERHKHELPRSHEVCVKRYQSNEKQIRELDAKYGNLVSMIQGLGAKHQVLLPKEPEEGAAIGGRDEENADKVRQWASSVSAQPGRTDGEEEEDRRPQFERPLRDVRVGESPSRPWGIQVPAKYLEETRSESSSRPAEVKVAPLRAAETKSKNADVRHNDEDAPGRCPFGFDRSQAPPPMGTVGMQEPAKAKPDTNPSQPAYEQARKHVNHTSREKTAPAKMVFTGPVFFGYNAEDAARILRDSGLGAAP